MNLEKSIKEFDVNEKTLNILSENNINTINDVWILKRSELKNMGISDSQINKIRIKLQLMGMDLNKKIYRNY